MSASTIAGVVLAGGKSRRMNRDKAAILVDGTPQVRRLAGLLAAFCDPVLVSVAAGGSTRALYCGLRTVEDQIPHAGPLGGIVSAHLACPNAALAVVAVDLFGLNEEIFEALLTARQHAACDCGGPQRCPVAVAVISNDGGPEPLCAIWEPPLLHAAHDAFMAGARSARSVLRQRYVWLVTPPAGRVRNANTPDELYEFLCDTGRLQQKKDKSLHRNDLSDHAPPVGLEPTT